MFLRLEGMEVQLSDAERGPGVLRRLLAGLPALRGLYVSLAPCRMPLEGLLPEPAAATRG